MDLDYYHIDEFKLQKDQHVFLMEDRHVYVFEQALVTTEMDELCFIKVYNEKSLNKTPWEAPDKGRIFVEGVWETSHMVRDIFPIY